MPATLPADDFDSEVDHVEHAEEPIEHAMQQAQMDEDAQLANLTQSKLERAVASRRGGLRQLVLLSNAFGFASKSGESSGNTSPTSSINSSVVLSRQQIDEDREADLLEIRRKEQAWFEDVLDNMVMDEDDDEEDFVAVRWKGGADRNLFDTIEEEEVEDDPVAFDTAEYSGSKGWLLIHPSPCRVLLTCWLSRFSAALYDTSAPFATVSSTSSFAS